MNLHHIDGGKAFDFGRVSREYARWRDVYPDSMYRKLIDFGVGKPGQQILDLGTGTAILPLHLYSTGAVFTATDISEQQIAEGRRLAAEKGADNIRFKVCGAEDTGFADASFDAVTAVQCFQYFDADRAAQEIRRVLRPGGIFCKIFMDWMPAKDPVIAEMEALVLRCNPMWTGGGFERWEYRFPDWARGRFEIETIHSYDAVLSFTREAWLGRILSCRGVGASLRLDQIQSFEREYRDMLRKYDDHLRLLHQIHIEIYRSIGD